MADTQDFKQVVNDAILDADSLERFINGSDSETVLTRLSAEYPTLQKALKELFENGGLPATPFTTLDALLLGGGGVVEGGYAIVTEDSKDKNGLYIKKEGDWVRSKYDLLNQALVGYKSSFNKSVKKYAEHDTNKHLLQLQDSEGSDYGIITSDGHLYLANTFSNKSLQSAHTELNTKLHKMTEVDDSDNLLSLSDSSGRGFAAFDKKGALHLQNDVYKDGVKVSHDYQDDDRLFTFVTADDKVAGYFDSEGSFTVFGGLNVSGNITSQGAKLSNSGLGFGGNSWAFHRDYLKERVTPFMKEFTVHDFADDNLMKRMPAAIKTDTGFVTFHHQQVEGFDGDATGSELYKAVCTVDDEYNVTVVSNELFQKANEPVGIIKHPMLGRTKGGRIVLLFERNENYHENPVNQKYVCFSDDEGVNFTEPRHLPTISTMHSGLGTTGTILTNSAGRMICPAYTNDGRVFALLSDDDGESWRYGEITSSIYGHEPSLTRNFDGSILMDVRPLASYDTNYTSDKRHRLRSFDEGETWVEWLDAITPESDNNCGSLYADHTTGLVFQTITNTHNSKVRRRFRVLVSTDGGLSFPYTFQPFEDYRYVGYSQFIKYDEGVYMISAEYATYDLGSYAEQSSRVIFLTLNEVLNNVTYS